MVDAINDKSGGYGALAEAVQAILGAESEAIVMYEQLLAATDNEASRRTLCAIVAEERSHVAELKLMLSALSGEN